MHSLARSRPRIDLKLCREQRLSWEFERVCKGCYGFCVLVSSLLKAKCVGIFDLESQNEEQHKI
jgi:hypothetical protein